MSELLDLFKKLSEFYDSTLNWEQIEEIYEKEIATRDEKKRRAQDQNNSEEDEDTHSIGGGVISLPLVQRALNDRELLGTVLELSTTIRNSRGQLKESSTNVNDDYWNQVVKVSPRDPFLSFVYTIAGLASLDTACEQYTKLSLAIVSMYILSLTIPGAKCFHIFEEDVIHHCLKVFALVDQIQNPDVLRLMPKDQPYRIWASFSTLCEDLKILFCYVHFDECIPIRDAILKKFINIQYTNNDRGIASKYISDLHSKCFEIFDGVLNTQNGEPEETLMKMMNMTVHLHTYAPKPKGVSGYDTRNCKHISDWFIECIAKYPRLLVKWKNEQIQRALEYAGKYDAALFIKCNESSVTFLCDAIYAEETMIRSRAIELIGQVLQLESEVDWQMFRHEVSKIPREVHLIKELIDSLQDSNNNIRLKSMHMLHAALTKGSPNAQKILREGIKFAEFLDMGVTLPDEPRVCRNEKRFEKPIAEKPTYTFVGHGLIELSILHLPEYVYMHLLRNPMSYIRRAGVMFMEQVAKLNPLVIFNTHFVAEFTRLVGEPVALVRKQTLLTIDTILQCYPNCYPVIWVWCKIITPMLQDGDPKNTEVAMECFRSRVLQNIRGIEDSNEAEHFMPWVIIRTLLSTQSRLYLQKCFQTALQQRMIDSKKVSFIESHLLTSNSTEAWVLLNFISGKIKSREPDALIHLFISSQSWNEEQNMLIALEVLSNYIKDFSHTALNQAFNHIISGIREGKMLPVLIGKAFDFLIHISNHSQTHAATAKDDDTWITDLHDFLENRILSLYVDFPGNRSIFLSYLYSYSEVNLQTRIRPHPTIITFIHRYMRECIKLPESELDSENERLFNAMILIAGRFSLRDVCVASTTCTLYGAVLQAVDRPPIVNTIIVCLADLCKKHTQIVERILEKVLQKLESPFVVNRIETFKCFEGLVLQDQLKLRGALLLAFLAAIPDDCQQLATRATEFFREFLSKKNPVLFQQCLIECPFVLNEYKNFDGLESFAEIIVKSPLKGDSKRKSRHFLYNHLMADMNEVNLVLYFEQLKLIADKSKHDPQIKSAEGIELIKDVLFIAKRVCQITKEQKSAENKDGAENNEDDPMPDMDNTAPALAPAIEVKATTLTTGGGRGRRRQKLTTMPEALNVLEKSIVFIHTIYKNIHGHDGSIEKYFDSLCKALATRFPNLVDYAQPAAFWSKYRQSKVITATDKKKTHKRKINETLEQEDGGQTDVQSNVAQTDVVQANTEETDAVQPDSLQTGVVQNQHNSVDESTSNYDSDDEIPLLADHLQVIPAKCIRRSRREFPMEYLFNTNI